MRIPRNAIRPALRQRRVTDFCVKMLSWRMFDVEGFIEAVKARPALYNSKHENFNRKEVRTQMWDEIGRIMYPEWDGFDDRDKNQKSSLMQKKWKSLKDCFNREVRMQKTQDPNRVRKKYEFYDRLTFLLHKNKPEPAKPVEFLKEVRVKLEALPQNATIEPSVPIQTLEGSARKRRLKIKDLVKPKHVRVSAESDSDRLFLMSFINDFKVLPLATKYWVKMKFSEIMHQAAMSLDEHLEVGSPVNEFTEEGSTPDSSASEIYFF